MSTMIDDDDFNDRLKYAPPWARQAAARAPAEPREDHPVDLDQHRRRVKAFDGDVALRELRTQLSLDPDAVPTPPAPAAASRSARTLALIAGACAIVAAAGLGAYLLASSVLTPSSPAPGDSAPAANLHPAVKSDRAMIPAAAVDADASRPAAPAEPPSAMPSSNPASSAAAPEPPAPTMSAPAAPIAATAVVVPNPPAPPPVAANAEPAPAAPQVQSLDREEIATLIARGRSFIANGDIAAARLVLRRAADAGDAAAALLLGSTFDPATLRPLKVIGTAPDVEQARKWYQRAAELGSAEAGRRLAMLAGGR
jgi:hypothetical protein